MTDAEMLATQEKILRDAMRDKADRVAVKLTRHDLNLMRAEGKLTRSEEEASLRFLLLNCSECYKEHVRSLFDCSVAAGSAPRSSKSATAKRGLNGQPGWGGPHIVEPIRPTQSYIDGIRRQEAEYRKPW